MGSVGQCLRQKCDDLCHDMTAARSGGRAVSCPCVYFFYPCLYCYHPCPTCRPRTEVGNTWPVGCLSLLSSPLPISRVSLGFITAICTSFRLYSACQHVDLVLPADICQETVTAPYTSFVLADDMSLFQPSSFRKLKRCMLAVYRSGTRRGGKPRMTFDTMFLIRRSAVGWSSSSPHKPLSYWSV